jgi:hypothetical protein
LEEAILNMGFPPYGISINPGKKNIIGRIHIKYVDNMDLKTKTNDLHGKISKKWVILKRTTL